MMRQNKHLNLLTVIGMVLSCLKEPVCCCLKIMSTLKRVVLILLGKLSATVVRQMHIISPTPLLMGPKKQCSWQSNEQAFMHKTLITSMHMGQVRQWEMYQTTAIKEVFGEHAYQLKVSSTKSMTGHLFGAAGGIESIITLKSMAENTFPP